MTPPPFWEKFPKNTVFFGRFPYVIVYTLRLVQKPLPLPPPQDKIWMATQHVIDDLHIVNHKRQKCHTMYNPKKVKEVVPDANLICAEQTFAWQSRSGVKIIKNKISF